MTPWMICSTNYEFNLEMLILQWLPRTPEFSFIGMWRRSTLLTDDLDLHMPLPLTLCQVTALSPPAAVGLLTCVPRSRYPVRVSNSIFNNIPIVVIHTRYGILHFFIRHPVDDIRDDLFILKSPTRTTVLRRNLPYASVEPSQNRRSQSCASGVIVI